MEPKLKVDDAVIIVKANPEDLKPGDIINFTAFESETNLTHRITKKEFTANGYEFRTKGDNSGSEDAFITTQDRILGKYFMRIPKLAKFLDFTSQKPYVIAILVAIILLIQFVCGALENKLGPAKSGSAVAAITADAHTEDPPAAAQQLSEQPAEAEQFAKPQQQEAIDEHARRLQGVFVESWEDEKGSASDETEE
jgi:signal peptidase I